ncbi:MAG TPA: VWA domain-containing protein [Solirubrobacteraceae bacterium]|nr:VWA domain-containing protein [Solirubrobacteraceae bacterium]
MSFATPLVLLGLLAIPVLVYMYAVAQRRRAAVANAFVTKPLTPSVAPHRPRWRRHVPMAAIAVALAILIVAAARPQRSAAVPVTDAAVMLVNDVSSSMASTDVTPSRLGAAERAASRFLTMVPAHVRVGLLEFNEKPIVLQSPTTDHALTQSALTQLRAGGHTAIGDAINTAVRSLLSLRGQNGKRPPAAIVLLSDGTSTNGANPIAAAKQAAAQHIPVYTVALGTSHGTITVKHGTSTQTVPVPLDPQELEQIASVSGARSFTVNDSGQLKAVYAHLATQLGHKHVKHEITASFAGGGLVLLLFGSVLSLLWFGRLV